ncbi:hypothetical protein WJR50_00760 [Catalinimonas sp. 4WD22]|uniref:hypothetical protein n=1 Tax=Catalinimonas locisalis TaxID=3133978 RepID=UPI003100D931
MKLKIFYIESLAEIIKKLEKFGKVLAIKTRKENELSVAKNLSWLETNFDKLLKLSETNPIKFNAFINPYKSYTKLSVDISQLGYSSINFEESYVNTSPKTFTEDNIFPSTNQLISSYSAYDSIIFIYQDVLDKVQVAAVSSNKDIILRNCQYIAGNWLYKLNKLDKIENINFNSVVSVYLKNIIYFTEKNLQTFLTFKKGNVLLSSYRILLEIIFKEDFNIRDENIFFKSLLNELILRVNYEDYNEIKNFLRSITHGSYSFHESSDSYFKLRRILASEDETGESNGFEEKLRNYHSIFTKNEFDAYLDDLEKIRQLKVVRDNKEYLSIIRELKMLFLSAFKYNRLRLIVLSFLAYCLFKKTFNIIDFYFNFHNPPDNDAIWANRDILPRDLFELLPIIKHSSFIADQLIYFFPDHHGSGIYVTQLFILLFLKNYHIDEEERKRVVTNHVNSLKRSETELLKGNIQSVLNSLENFPKRPSEYLYQSYLDEAKKKLLTKFLKDIISDIDQNLQVQEESSPISEETIKSFKENLLNSYNKASLLKELFKYYGNYEIRKDIYNYQYSFGYSDIRDRIEFLEEISSGYVSSARSYGMQFSTIENSLILSEIRGSIESKSQVPIYEYELEDTLDNIDLKQKILISCNVGLNYKLRKNKNFQIKEEPEKKRPELSPVLMDKLIGKYKEANVFEINDRFFQRSIYILPKQIGKFYQMPIETEGAIQYEEIGEGIYFNIVDFSLEEKERSSLIEKNPDWLTNEVGKDSEKQKSYLLRKVWIRLYKNSKVDFPDNTDSYYITFK